MPGAAIVVWDAPGDAGTAHVLLRPNAAAPHPYRDADVTAVDALGFCASASGELLASSVSFHARSGGGLRLAAWRLILWDLRTHSALSSVVLSAPITRIVGCPGEAPARFCSISKRQLRRWAAETPTAAGCVGHAVVTADDDEA